MLGQYRVDLAIRFGEYQKLPLPASRPIPRLTKNVHRPQRTQSPMSNVSAGHVIASVNVLLTVRSVTLPVICMLPESARRVTLSFTVASCTPLRSIMTVLSAVRIGNRIRQARPGASMDR